MARQRRIYEGKTKDLFEGPEPGTLVQHFRDDATAFSNKKHGLITGKGVLNNRISEYLMLRLHDIGVPTHLIRRLNMREQLVREVEIIPVRIAVRNMVAGSMAERFGIDEGTPLPRDEVDRPPPSSARPFGPLGPGPGRGLFMYCTPGGPRVRS